MITIAAAAILAAAVQVPVDLVAADARAIDRVAAYSKRDLPHDLLVRMLNQDIDYLRGRHPDGTYDYAGYERFESGRVSNSYSLDSRGQTLELRGPSVYRLLIYVPKRRLVFAQNRRIYVDRVELEYLPLKANVTRTQNVKVDAWLDPGTTRAVEFDDIARQATVRVFARGDEKSGYGNVTLSLLEGRVFDNPDSPYADAVASAKAILRALDHDDAASMRAMATRMADDLRQPVNGGQPPAAAQVTAMAPAVDVYPELLVIQDLLGGNEVERKQGLARLRDLIDKVRPQAH